MLGKWAIVSLLAAATVVNGQSTGDPSPVTTSSKSSTTSSSSSSKTSSASDSEETSSQGKVIRVKVGYPLGAHAFDPAEITANKGDVVEFEMFPANHSVAQMDPKAPCIPWDLDADNAKTNKKAFYTGFEPVQGANTLISPVKFTVEDDQPVWFYCSAKGSCPKYQMILVVNPEVPEKDLLVVKNLAAKQDFSMSPGETEFPSDSDDTVTGGVDESGADADTVKAADEANKDSGSSGLSAGAIAGIVIGAVAAFALVGLLFFLVGRKKKSRELDEKSAANEAGHLPPKAPDAEQQMMGSPEHPPMYDPRFSMQPPPPSPRPWSGANIKTGHQSMMSEDFNHERNPNRLSELPSQNYDPVEIYTPGLQAEHHGHDVPSPIAEEATSPRDSRRDTVG